jgi:N-acetylneuraminic acid mutarotase
MCAKGQRLKKQLLLISLSVTMIAWMTLVQLASQMGAANAETTEPLPPLEWLDLGEQAFYPGELGISEGQSVVVNNLLYVFGGYEFCCFPIRRVYRFDPTTNIWTRLADLPQGTTHTGIATDGTDIYLAGGYVENLEEQHRIPGSEKVWRYNVGANTYTALPNLPKKASTGQLVYVKGKLHYIGGTTPITQEQDLPDHFTFDLKTYATNPNVQWVDITSSAGLPNPRQHSGIAVVDNQIYYIGGQYKHNDVLVPQDDVHRYDPQTNTWTQLADMPAPRNHMSNTTVVLNGKIIVMGGQKNHGDGQDDVYQFNPTTNTWTTLPALPMEQYSAIGGVINGVLYFGTGDKGNFNNDRRRMVKGVFGATPTPTTTLASTLSPTITAQPVTELLTDGGFEDGSDVWTVKGASGDRVKCNKPGKTIAYGGQCAFQFKGGGADGTAENSSLSQKLTAGAGLPAFAAGDALALQAYVNVKQNPADADLMIVVKFGDATAKVKRKRPLNTNSGYQLVSDSFTLPSAVVGSIKVTVKHRSTNGKLLVDALSLKRQPNAQLQPETLLPLP